MKKIKPKKIIPFLKYIGIAFGVVLLSSWSPKISSLVISHQQELKGNVFKEITGVVKTEYGDPIPGVTVKLKGTNIETVTDAEGRYKFNVKKGDRIQFVFEGFRTVMFTVSQNNVLNIAMVEDDTKMLCMIEDIYRTMVKDRMAHGNNVSSDIIVKRRQDSIFKEIKGIVKTDQGDPIPGAVVLKLGTNQGTETDIEGRYSLNVNEGDKIQFVYEGFKTTTVTVSKSNILNITMIEEGNIDMTDVTVDVYRTTSRETIGCVGSFYKPKTIEEYIEKQNIVSTTVTSRILCGGWPATRNFTQLLLQAQIPGLVILPSDYLETNRNPETILKDVENLTRNGNYTYIVDGVRVSEEMYRSLNQNDVESVDIYKRTDVYNARFGNKENQSRISLNAR